MKVPCTTEDNHSFVYGNPYEISIITKCHLYIFDQLDNIFGKVKWALKL